MVDGDKKRPNLKLSRETGEETRKALKRYRDGYELDSLEDAIRHALPDWAFDSRISPEVAVMIEASRHYSLDDVVGSDGDATSLLTGSKTSRSTQTLVMGKPNRSWEKRVHTVQRLLQKLQESAQEMGYDLSDISVYDIGSQDSFTEAGFHKEGERDLDELGDWCEEWGEHLVDIESTSGDATGILLDTLSDIDSSRIIALLPKEQPITSISEENVPSTLHFQEVSQMS